VEQRYILYNSNFYGHGGSSYYIFAEFFAYVDNEDHKRMHALRALVDAEYRQDLISNNLGEWIINGQSHSALHDASDGCFSEYATASKRLGDTRTDNPYMLYSLRESPAFGVINGFLGDLPIVGSLSAFTALNVT
jgi:hypothetical protein